MHIAITNFALKQSKNIVNFRLSPYASARFSERLRVKCQESCVYYVSIVSARIFGKLALLKYQIQRLWNESDRFMWEEDKGRVNPTNALFSFHFSLNDFARIPLPRRNWQHMVSMFY